MKCYLTEVQNFIQDGKQEGACSVLPFLDRERAKRVRKIRHENTGNCSITAGLLLRYAFLKEGFSQEEWKQIEITIGKDGKPYIPQFCFSLSHSGAYVALAVDHRPVGMDLQLEDQEGYLKIAKRFFHPEEYRWLLEENDFEKQKKHFYQIWTGKEAYGKYIGCGIQGMEKWLVQPNAGVLWDENQKKSVALMYWEGLERYSLCLCGDSMIAEHSGQQNICFKKIRKEELMPKWESYM